MTPPAQTPPATPSSLVDRALDTARRLNPDGGAVALVRERSEAVLRWANSTMTTNGDTTDRRLTVIALVPVPGGTGAGVAGAAAPDALVVESAEGAAIVEELVRAAIDGAVRSGPARDAFELPRPQTPFDTGFVDAGEATSVGVFSRLAEELADSFAAARSFGFAEHRVTTTWLGTSAGVRRRWVEPTGSVELNLKDPATGASVWGGSGTRDFTDVTLGGLVEGLSARLAWGRRRVELPAGRYETLLPPSAVADLLIYLAWSMGGRPAHEGRSAFSAPPGHGGTKVGERLTDLPLTLAGDPSAPGFAELAYEPTLAATESGDEISVFDNGAATRRVDWLREGTVGELAYPRAAAAEFGTLFAPPSENLILTGGSTSGLPEMISTTRRGLLLTCLWYIREVDPATLLLTGMTRDGVYLVEDGEVVGEVNNFRFNESPLDLVRRVAEAGATERTLPREWKDWFTRTAMPALRVPDFHMSSVSPGR